MKRIENAINLGNYEAKGNGLACIGWNQNRAEWVIYKTTGGVPEGVTPEFLCIGSGVLPVPLSSEGIQIFNELFN